VKSLAKRLIHTWKKQLEAENSHDNISKDNVVNSDTGGSDIDQTPTTTGTDPTSLRGSKLNSVKTESSSRETNRTSLPDVPDTTDDVRSKCRDMLVKALKKTHVEGIDDHHIVHLAAVIEDCIYQEFKSSDQKYKARVRSRVSNLGDNKNPELCRKVITGEISPNEIARMTTMEMASDDMKKLRKEYTKEGIRESQMAIAGGTKTDMLKCGRCKKTNCTYNQVQTRSADEPMTTFAYCNECGNRWKVCCKGAIYLVCPN
jgi:transcription elongation factor S-II